MAGDVSPVAMFVPQIPTQHDTSNVDSFLCPYSLPPNTAQQTHSLSQDKLTMAEVKGEEEDKIKLVYYLFAEERLMSR